jgi:hypothetical protein
LIVPPPAASKCGNASRLTRNGAVRLIASARLQQDSSLAPRRAVAPPTPAELTTPSIPVRAAQLSATAFLTPTSPAVRI